MKTKYLSSQFKQFLLSTAFVLVAIVGVSISNSFDQDYMAKVSEHEKMIQNVAETEKQNSEKDDEDSDVAMK